MDAVTVVGSAMLPAAVELGADPAAIAVASMGADLENRFTPGTAERDRNLIVFAGRLVEKKGVRHLLDALSRARQKIPSLRLVVAGDGPERAALEARARELGIAAAVEFRGAVPQDELAALYRAAGAAAFPFVTAAGGDQEGFGLVVIEAQGCGCPVIAADVAAVRDTVANGETGLLVPPGDAAALADRIVEVLNDLQLAGKLGAGGRRAALSAFDWERCADRYRDILRRARDRSAGNPA
jgi:glycosyltransferase involved in cell wall biosynthesis